jgi:hypothetical protein
MKLRIKGNTLRIRVSRSELAKLLGGERVEDAIQFTSAPESRLTYSLQAAPQSKAIAIEWKPQWVTVSISKERMNKWALESEVGIYEAIHLGPAGSLAVTIEKDFACLDGSDGENADSFDNPRAACS